MRSRLNQNDVTNRINVEDPDQVRDAVLALFTARYPGADLAPLRRAFADDLKWREAKERERLWVVAPGHPITEGLGEYIEIPHEEMYGEFFDIPAPDTLVLVSWFQGGEIFRSGCCYHRGSGKVFYFRPGHETYPTYYQPEVLRVIGNAVRWAARVAGPHVKFGHRPQPIEEIR